MPGTDVRYDLDSPVPLHRLVYLVEGDEVTIGRRDTDSYGIFPPDGAEIVRRLEDGQTPRQVARWYEGEYGESTDIEHILAALEELELLQDAGKTPARDGTVRWQRLGQALFSPVAWAVYLGLIAWAGLAMIRSPDLVPTYKNLFFTEYYTLIELGLFAGAIPLLLLHEAFHALAARRLGLRSRLRVSRRLYYIVLETNLDGLVSVPRRKRYLPILAGVWSDVLSFAVLTIAADLTRRPDGSFTLAGKLCLAFAFATVLRVVWQFFFYLRTDLYALITTLLGCVDLHTTARRTLRNRIMRALGRPERIASETDWHPVDRAAARWYSWLIVVGYTVSIGTFLWGVLPAVYQMFAGALGRLWGTAASSGELADSAVFLSMNVMQIALTVWMALRERRARRTQQLQHVIA